jgi:hypothetical protein
MPQLLDLSRDAAEALLADTAHYDVEGEKPRECGHPCCGETCGPRAERRNVEGGEG